MIIIPEGMERAPLIIIRNPTGEDRTPKDERWMNWPTIEEMWEYIMALPDTDIIEDSIYGEDL